MVHPTISPELLKVRTVAEITDASMTTVRRWIDRGELRHVRLGNAIRIRRTDLEEFIEAGIERSQAA